MTCRCDIVDVSAGQTVPDQRPRSGRLFQTPFADRIRHDVGMATMAVGNISSFKDANTIIADPFRPIERCTPRFAFHFGGDH